MHRRSKIFVVFWVILGFSQAGAFSESDAVKTALENNPDIKTSTIALGRDSLDFKKVKSEAYLQAQITGDKILELHPSIRSSFPGGDTTSSTLETSLRGSVSRHIPGGGNVSAFIENSGTQNLSESGADFTTTSGLTVTQPLLKGAWSNSPVDYQINIEKKNLNISEEKFKGEMLEILSRVREGYLDWLSAVNTLEIRKAEWEYAQNAMVFEKTRFQLGEKAEMDTLTAALELLRARENLMSAEYALKTSKKRFALELGLEADKLPELSDLTIPVNPIPSASVIMRKVEQDNYQLKVLDLTRDILELQYSNNKNALLPRVDLSAGITNSQRRDGFLSSSQAGSSGPDVLDPWIGIMFTYDILKRKEKLSKRQTELSLKSNEIEREFFMDQQRVAIAEFADAWAQDSAKLGIRTAEVTIAEKNHKYAVERYQLGEIDNLAKLKAQSDLINARLNRLLAQVNLKRLEISVDKATTNVLNRFGVMLK